jgi:hypothetical protein
MTLISHPLRTVLRSRLCAIVAAAARKGRGAERGQALAITSGEHLSKPVAGQSVIVRDDQRDPYGSIVGRVTLDGGGLKVSRLR